MEYLKDIKNNEAVEQTNENHCLSLSFTNERNNMKFNLPQLPYAIDALKPIISEATITYHFGKHEQSYINNLNNLIQGTPYENMGYEEIIKNSDGPLFNNASQAWNHIFYFFTFTPSGASDPKGKLSEAIIQEWGTIEDFKKAFVIAGTGIFGSGWVWLVKTKDNQLKIITTSNAGNPLTTGSIPLLTFDVWEHAYYLDYQNRRADHLNELWKIVDWKIVEQRYL